MKLVEHSEPTFGFAKWSVNPYGGCVYGCQYCYVPHITDGSVYPVPWGEYLVPRRRVPEEVTRLADQLRGESVVMSPFADPYPPIEPKQLLTRSALERLVDVAPRHLYVLTRSPLVVRDADVLTRFGDRVTVCVSIPTDREDVCRRIEPTAPSVARRLSACQELRAAGVRVQVLAVPLAAHTERFAEVLRTSADVVFVDVFRDHGKAELRPFADDPDYVAWQPATRLAERIRVASSTRVVLGKPQLVSEEMQSLGQSILRRPAREVMMGRRQLLKQIRDSGFRQVGRWQAAGRDGQSWVNDAPTFLCARLVPANASLSAERQAYWSAVLARNAVAVPRVADYQTIEDGDYDGIVLYENTSGLSSRAGSVEIALRGMEGALHRIPVRGVIRDLPNRDAVDRIANLIEYTRAYLGPPEWYCRMIRTFSHRLDVSDTESSGVVQGRLSRDSVVLFNNGYALVDLDCLGLGNTRIDSAWGSVLRWASSMLHLDSVEERPPYRPELAPPLLLLGVFALAWHLHQVGESSDWAGYEQFVLQTRQALESQARGHEAEF